MMRQMMRQGRLAVSPSLKKNSSSFSHSLPTRFQTLNRQKWKH